MIVRIVPEQRVARKAVRRTCQQLHDTDAIFVLVRPWGQPSHLQDRRVKSVLMNNSSQVDPGAVRPGPADNQRLANALLVRAPLESLQPSRALIFIASHNHPTCGRQSPVHPVSRECAQRSDRGFSTMPARFGSKCSFFAVGKGSKLSLVLGLQRRWTNNRPVKRIIREIEGRVSGAHSRASRELMEAPLSLSVRRSPGSLSSRFGIPNGEKNYMGPSAARIHGRRYSDQNS